MPRLPAAASGSDAANSSWLSVHQSGSTCHSPGATSGTGVAVGTGAGAGSCAWSAPCQAATAIGSIATTVTRAAASAITDADHTTAGGGAGRRRGRRRSLRRRGRRRRDIRSPCENGGDRRQPAPYEPPVRRDGEELGGHLRPRERIGDGGDGRRDRGDAGDERGGHDRGEPGRGEAGPPGERAQERGHEQVGGADADRPGERDECTRGPLRLGAHRHGVGRERAQERAREQSGRGEGQPREPVAHDPGETGDDSGQEEAEKCGRAHHRTLAGDDLRRRVHARSCR